MGRLPNWIAKLPGVAASVSPNQIAPNPSTAIPETESAASTALSPAPLKPRCPR